MPAKRMLKKIEKIATSSMKPKTKVNKAIKSVSFKNTRKKLIVVMKAQRKKLIVTMKAPRKKLIVTMKRFRLKRK